METGATIALTPKPVEEEVYVRPLRFLSYILGSADFLIWMPFAVWFLSNLCWQPGKMLNNILFVVYFVRGTTSTTSLFLQTVRLWHPGVTPTADFINILDNQTPGFIGCVLLTHRLTSLMFRQQHAAMWRGRNIVGIVLVMVTYPYLSLYPYVLHPDCFLIASLDPRHCMYTNFKQMQIAFVISTVTSAVPFGIGITVYFSQSSLFVSSRVFQYNAQYNKEISIFHSCIVVNILLFLFTTLLFISNLYEVGLLKFGNVLTQVFLDLSWIGFNLSVAYIISISTAQLHVRLRHFWQKRVKSRFRPTTRSNTPQTTNQAQIYLTRR